MVASDQKILWWNGEILNKRDQGEFRVLSEPYDDFLYVTVRATATQSVAGPLHHGDTRS